MYVIELAVLFLINRLSTLNEHMVKRIFKSSLDSLQVAMFQAICRLHSIDILTTQFTNHHQKCFTLLWLGNLFILFLLMCYTNHMLTAILWNILLLYFLIQHQQCCLVLLFYIQLVADIIAFGFVIISIIYLYLFSVIIIFISN